MPPLSETRTGTAAASTPAWKTEFDDLPVPVSVEWTGLQIDVADLGRLQPGSVLVWDQPGVSVCLKLNGVPRFLGRPGLQAGRWAVELTAPVSS